MGNGKLKSRNKTDNAYPSPPSSDVELNGKHIEEDEGSEAYLQLPNELEIDEDRLVRSALARRRAAAQSSFPTFASLFSLLTESPSPAGPSITSRSLGSPSSSSVLLPDNRRGSVMSVTHDRYHSHASTTRRTSRSSSSSQQYEIASTVQTVPQDTGFFTILGPFLLDMSIEISYLLWFFLSEMLWPKLFAGLKTLATPVLVWIPIILPLWRFASDLFAAISRPVSKRPRQNHLQQPTKDLSKLVKTRTRTTRRRKVML